MTFLRGRFSPQPPSRSTGCGTAILFTAGVWDRWCMRAARGLRLVEFLVEIEIRFLFIIS